tara:strand:+ start:17355 stop:17621 length:267 start_codon:yes stop_codon:yes gene_type:complete
MSKFILLFTAFTMIVSVTVCASHAAHASVDTDTEISISVDADSSEDTSLGSNGCDMSCAGMFLRPYSSRLRFYIKRRLIPLLTQKRKL